jgi:hypothetical protein
MTRGRGCPAACKALLEEALCGGCIPLRRKPKIDSCARRIDGPVEVAPVSTLTNVGFVNPQEPLVGFNSRRHLLLSSGAYRCTQRHTLVWSAGRPRSVRSSSTSRYDSENRRYQRTAQRIVSGAKCRHLNSAGLGLVIGSSLSDLFPGVLQHIPLEWLIGAARRKLSKTKRAAQ